MFPEVAMRTVAQTETHTKTVWKKNKPGVMNLKQSVPSFKLNSPILLHNKQYSLIQTPDQKDNYRNFSVVIKANLGSENSERTSYSFLVDAGEQSKRAIVERIIDGTYKQGAMQIVSDNKRNSGKKTKWYCIIPYTFEVELDTSLDPNKIMGIDLGISKAVYWAFSDSLKRGWINGNEIEEFRRRVQARRRSIQDQGKYCGDGRIGHGRARRLQPIEVLQDKEANFGATTNHKYARHVVEIAVKNRCGVIQMENLNMDDVKRENTFLHNWTYGDLRTKIKEKAALEGIQVNLIKPEYTSQRCSRCGYIDRNNRPDQATFVCLSCGYGGNHHCFDCGKDQSTAGECETCGKPTKKIVVNADFNAAKNIATLGIEEIIVAEIAKNGGETEAKPANVKRTRKPR